MKTIVGLVLFFGMAMCSVASEIGFIDTALIFQKASFVKTFRENYAEKEKDFAELVEKKSKKIEQAIAKKKPEKDIRDMIKKRDEELEPRKQELANYELSFQQTFLLNVTTTAKKVAKELDIDVVVDKQVLYYGGFDLTDLVLERLNDQ